jgi:hypothetical protein
MDPVQLLSSTSYTNVKRGFVFTTLGHNSGGTSGWSSGYGCVQLSGSEAESIADAEGTANLGACASV